MPETVKMALSRCYQTITNVTSQGEKLEIVFPLDNGHFITGGINFDIRTKENELFYGIDWLQDNLYQIQTINSN